MAELEHKSFLVYPSSGYSASSYVALATRLNCGLLWRLRRMVVYLTKRLFSTRLTISSRCRGSPASRRTSEIMSATVPFW